MLRVGLTGEMGSGKSTVARMLAGHGAIVLSSDDMGRSMMQPGQAVYAAIVEHFGTAIVLPDGQLDRPALAQLAFNREHPRVEELNAIVHPAVLAEQERQLVQIALSAPQAIVVIESALIFSTQHAGEEPWRKRFDCIVVVQAPEAVKIGRFVQRASQGKQLPPNELDVLEQDAEARLRNQRIPEALQAECINIVNDGTQEALARRTEEVFRELCVRVDDQVRDTR